MTKSNVSLKTNRFLWLDYVAVVIIVIAFFVISRCGFFTSDDIGRMYISGLDVLRHARWFYFNLGGRFLTVATTSLLTGALGDKLWFDIVNTLVFMLLIFICGQLISEGKEDRIHYTLIFALLFWFLCPVPNETLFWAAGSITHMWGDTLAFALLLLFLKYKDDSFGVAGKIGLFILSIVAAAEFIPCASICGAFVVYYAFHIKELKGNTVLFVVGFAIGSMLVLFAPGNFGRVELEGGLSFFDKIQDLANHPILELSKYKALWLFLIALVWGWIKDKKTIKLWMKNNSVLLLSLGWSIIAFSVVFRPANRALFFPETLSLVLFLKFLFDNYQVFGIRFLNEIMSNDESIARRIVISLLFVVFLVDSAFAVSETKKQSANNDMLLEQIADSGGIVALDRMVSSHRIAYVAVFPEWTWEPLADRFGLDSVHVYPYYCQDKLYNQDSFWENLYIDKVNLKDDDDLFGKYVRLIVRIENDELQALDNHVTFTIDYTRPRKWYKAWLDNLRNYQYERISVVERDKPDACFDGYSYYIIWFGRENVSGLKSVKYEIE